MAEGKTLYILADAGRARFIVKEEEMLGHEGYESDRKSLRLLRELVDANLHARTRDIMTDRPGRVRGGPGATSRHHAMDKRTNPMDVSKAAFVNSLADEIDAECRNGTFDHLVLVAPGRVLSELKGALSGAVVKKLIAEEQKDLTNIPLSELHEHLLPIGKKQLK